MLVLKFFNPRLATRKRRTSNIAFFRSSCFLPTELERFLVSWFLLFSFFFSSLFFFPLSFSFLSFSFLPFSFFLFFLSWPFPAYKIWSLPTSGACRIANILQAWLEVSASCCSEPYTMGQNREKHRMNSQAFRMSAILQAPLVGRDQIL